MAPHNPRQNPKEPKELLREASCCAFAAGLMKENGRSAHLECGGSTPLWMGDVRTIQSGVEPPHSKTKAGPSFCLQPPKPPTEGYPQAKRRSPGETFLPSEGWTPMAQGGGSFPGM